MKLIVFFIPCCLFALISSGQNLHFKKIKIGEIDSVELKDGSQKFVYDSNYITTVSEDYFPGRKKYRIEQPIVYRKQLDSLFLETSFYFSSGDSIVRLIEYWWRDTTNSLDLAGELLKSNKRVISKFFKNNGKPNPEYKDDDNERIWENKYCYVHLFPGGEGMRVLISWKEIPVNSNPKKKKNNPY